MSLSPAYTYFNTNIYVKLPGKTDAKNSIIVRYNISVTMIPISSWWDWKVPHVHR